MPSLQPASRLENLLHRARKIIPVPLFHFFQPAYHYILAFLGAAIYGFPSQKLAVIAVTGTKGKSTTVELIAHILETSHQKVAVLSTVHFRIGEKTTPNLYKMSVPGRFFVQRFLKQALEARCDYVILEMTSQAVLQYRHKWLALSALVFTNLSPEHIESHGSYEKYVAAKVELALELSRSKKANRVVVVNGDDKEAFKFLDFPIPTKIAFGLHEVKPFALTPRHSQIILFGKPLILPLPGEFNIMNALAAATLARALGIHEDVIHEAFAHFSGVRGRMERVSPEGITPPFDVIVDYAHTADSLEKVYRAFPGVRKICILGNTGGGRDKWKRPLMGGIAGYYCDHVILTNEDPYDEDPRAIVEQMAEGVKKGNCEIIMDRREAIRKAISIARPGDTVLITGKGTDPYIMGQNGSKAPWDDRRVTEEELRAHIT